jgi:hypothetical protein
MKNGCECTTTRGGDRGDRGGGCRGQTHTHQDAAECVGILRSQGFQQVCSLSEFSLSLV